jgi:hypothetical protein
MVALADPAIVSYPSAISRTRRRYVGHQGLRHWMRDVRAHDAGHQALTREIRRFEKERWAVLGELVIDEVPVSPFALLARVNEGLIVEGREYLSEESMLRELGHLP